MSDSKNQLSSPRASADRNAGHNAGRNDYRNRRYVKAYAVEEEEENDNPNEPTEGNYYANEDLDYEEPLCDRTEDYFGAALVTCPPAIHCKNCMQSFLSKNQLHLHLGNSGRGRKASKSSCQGLQKPSASALQTPSASQKPSAAGLGSRSNDPGSGSAFPAAAVVSKPRVIKSTSDSTKKVGTGYAFRQYYYAVIDIQLTSEAEPKKACVDSGCSVTLIDRAFLKSLLLDCEIRKLASPITVRGLGSSLHQTAEYAIIPLYF